MLKKIHIKDPAFETLVRKKLKKETGEITNEDMAKIEKFNGVIVITPFPENVVLNENHDEIAAVSDISGIEYCVNIQALSIKAETDNGCAELVPGVIENICRLKSLKHLFIKGDVIRHIEWLSELTSLETLQMFNMDIFEPKTLGELTRLIDILVADSKLEGIDWIYKAVKLKKLDLINVSIPEKLSFGGLKELSYFNVSSNIRTISLYDLPKLERAAFWLEKADDISTIGKFTTLKSLAITACHKIDITPVLALKELKNLHIGKNTIDDFEVIQEISGLESLSITQNNISDLRPLLSLPKLKFLSLFNCVIGDIETLKELSKSVSLSLNKNKTPSGELIDGKIIGCV